MTGPATVPPVPTNPVYWTSSNWSGYGVTGGPYTAVTGTFTVPSLSAGDTNSENTSAWVGIDGWGNQDLVQAGIDEEVDPGNSYVDIWPWWEVLPAASTPISSVSVSAGDSVNGKYRWWTTRTASGSALDRPTRAPARAQNGLWRRRKMGFRTKFTPLPHIHRQFSSPAWGQPVPRTP
jgi:hypothetical protein